MKKLTLAAALFFLGAGAARAAFEDTGAGARAPGMGDAFTALADDAYAAHYNPAGLFQLERPQFSAAYSRLYYGLSDGSDIGTSQLMYAHPLARGRNGTLGFGFERFSLSGMYQEQALMVAYGREIHSTNEGGRLAVGGTFKYLMRSFSPGSEASNACSGLNCSLGADPVLSGKHSKSVPDFDLGFIYRFPRRLQAGLSIQHAMSPNVGFSGSDKLERAINAGLAYKSLWMSLVGELKMRNGADGKMGRDMIFAAERYFPTLDHGQFGVRGSIGLGSAEWRQFTVGASYRVNKIQFDYAFLLPVGAITGQSGSHRLGLSYHLGAPTSDEEISRDLLDQARRLREHGPDYGYEYSQELKPQDLNDPRLADVRRYIEERQYRQAKKALTDYAERQPLSPALIRLSNRLGLVAFYYADLPEPKERFDRALVFGLRRFFYGQDRLAILQTSYAFSQKPDDARLGRLLEEMEKALGLKAMRTSPDSARGFLEELLHQAEFANTRGDVGRVESILSDVLELEPENAMALERLGSLRYMSGRLPEAISAWEAAAKIETREQELISLREYLRRARDQAAGKPLPGGAGPLISIPETPAPAPAANATPAAPVTAAPAPLAPAARPAATPAPASVRGDPRDVASLYQKGVEHYARGEYLQASAMFLRILQIDPENEQARKALERIDRMRKR